MRLYKKILIFLSLAITGTATYLYLFHRFIFVGIALLFAEAKPELIGSNILELDPTIVTIEQLDTFIAAQLEVKSIKGAAVAIVANGEVAWSKGYGFADEEAGVVASADTPFMLGSISKSVIGIALMHAAEVGTLDLDRDINDYLDFTVQNPRMNTQEPITLRHLATHTSGIIDNLWTYADSYDFGDPTVSLEQFLRGYLLEDGENYKKRGNFLASAPGEISNYSNIGAGLAGHVLAGATGVRLDKYAKEHIFSPLGMDNTGWFLADFPDTSIIARPYTVGNRPFSHYGYSTWPDGQIRSSANDLASLLAMVMNNGQFEGEQILGTAAVEKLLNKQQFPGLADEIGQGIFWEHTRSGLLGHNGGDTGVLTAMYFNPETQIGVVVLTNADIHRGEEPVFSIVQQITTSESTPILVDSLP